MANGQIEALEKIQYDTAHAVRMNSERQPARRKKLNSINADQCKSISANASITQQPKQCADARIFANFNPFTPCEQNSFQC